MGAGGGGGGGGGTRRRREVGTDGREDEVAVSDDGEAEAARGDLRVDGVSGGRLWPALEDPALPWRGRSDQVSYRLRCAFARRAGCGAACACPAAGA